MANVWKPRGLQNPRKMGGGMPGTMSYQVTNAITHPIYPGDFVRVLPGIASNFISNIPAATKGTLPALQTTAAGVLGVSDGFCPASGTDSNTGPREISVITDLGNVTWEVQLTAYAANTYIGKRVSITGGGAGAAIGTSAGNTTLNHSTLFASVLVTGICECVQVNEQVGKNDISSAGATIVVKIIQTSLLVGV